MQTRRLLAVLASVLAISAASCGSDDGTTSEPVDTIAHPTDPEAAIVRVGAPGWLPSVVIGGDGWLYRPAGHSSGEARRLAARPLARTGGAHPAAAPAPPEPTPVERRQLTPEGIQTILAFADGLGLLATPGEYEDPGVTDMGSTYVTISVDGGTYEHVAYALGFEDETGNRRDLETFVEALADIDTLVDPDDIGPAEPYEPDIHAVSIGGTFDTGGLDVTWPSDLSVEEGCVALPADRFADGVAGSYIAIVDGVETRVAVVPDLPGDDC